MTVRGPTPPILGAVYDWVLPGSGKTEISKNLIKDSGVELLRIDMDEIAEMLPDYEPSKGDGLEA